MDGGEEEDELRAPLNCSPNLLERTKVIFRLTNRSTTTTTTTTLPKGVSVVSLHS